MKTKLVIGGILAAGFLLSGCGVSVGYDEDGRWHRGHRHGGHHRGYESASISTESQSKHLARDYNIRVASAQKLFAVIGSSSPQKDLAEMNVNIRDVAPLAHLDMPSEASVHNVAIALNEPEATVAQVMKDYIADIREENGSNADSE